MKICVIGLGSMGRRRIRLIKKMNIDVTIIGVDNNIERVKSVANEYNIDCYVVLHHNFMRQLSRNVSNGDSIFFLKLI